MKVQKINPEKDEKRIKIKPENLTVEEKCSTHRKT
jgi:hypothetical protein